MPPFKYQDQLQEIMFMGHKQEYLLRKLVEHVTSGKQIQAPQLSAEKVKLGLDVSLGTNLYDVDNSKTYLHESKEPMGLDKLISRLNCVKYMDIENILSDNDLYTIGKSCPQLVGLTLTGCGISNFGIHSLAFTNFYCPYFKSFFENTKSDDSFSACSCENIRSNASLSLQELNIKGLTNVDYVGVLIALRAFKSLRRIDCRNESLCVAIEHVSRLKENVEWNSEAIKILECGLKQTLLFSIFKHTNGNVYF